MSRRAPARYPSALAFQAVSRFLAAAAAATLLLAPARPTRAATDLASVPPADPAWTTGTLSNGMTYFIRANPKPENHVELRLALKAGSVLETEEQRGLAHFNEHMSFNGSEHFKSGDLVSYLESIGARFGADSNAYTSYDETVYMLQVPTDKEGALDKGMLILRDWAGGALMETTEIEKERGVVLDELRRGKGARKRVRDKQDQVLYHGSRYADRTPIGLEKVITGAAPDVLRTFRKDWYRPELMAVVVVGTVDPKAMEARIKELFSSIPASAKPVDRPQFPVPPHDDTLYSVEADKELTASTISVTCKHEPPPVHTVGDERRQLVEAIAGALLTRRLSEKAQQPDPPFLGAGAGSGRYLNTLAAFSMSARAKDGELVKAAGALQDEMERARKFGFLDAELERVKEDILTDAESSYKEKDQRRSDERVGGAVESFLHGEPLTSDDFDHQFALEMVPGITLAEVNDMFRSLTEPRSRVVLCQAPDKPGAVPSVADIKGAIEPASGRSVEAYKDDLAGKSLLPGLPAGGRILSRHAIPELGVVEMTLSNGVRVVVKSTDFRSDEIQMSGFARGGASELPPEQFLAAMRSDDLANQSGLGEFTAPQLQKLLAGKAAGASPGVGLFSRTMNGGSTVKDFETMLQLVYSYFTQPAFRDDAFHRMIDREVEGVNNALNSPQGVFGRAATQTLYDDNRMFRPLTVADLRALRREDMEAAYRSFFNDGSEWTFVLVGNVDLEKHAPLIARYLGGLPTLVHDERHPARRVAFQDLPIHFPQGVVTRMVMKGIEDQSRTLFALDAPLPHDDQARFELDAACDLLEIRLRDLLREERGETYSVGVYRSDLLPYESYGTVQISFSGSPDKHAGMMKDTRAEIARLKEKLPTAAEVSKLQELRRNELEKDEKENGYWVGRLTSKYLRGQDPRTILGARDRIDRLSARAVLDASRRAFDLTRSAEIFLVPENWGPSKWLAKEVGSPSAKVRLTAPEPSGQ